VLIILGLVMLVLMGTHRCLKRRRRWRHVVVDVVTTIASMHVTVDMLSVVITKDVNFAFVRFLRYCQ